MQNMCFVVICNGFVGHHSLPSQLVAVWNLTYWMFRSKIERKKLLGHFNPWYTSQWWDTAVLWKWVGFCVSVMADLGYLIYVKYEKLVSTDGAYSYKNNTHLCGVFLVHYFISSLWVLWSPFIRPILQIGVLRWRVLKTKIQSYRENK